ncbi:MAG: RDD family protein [Bacteroidia bacterium]|nr:RDD family protein [Bacteroidia bacterium]
MADSTIITGQFVRISQTPASIGERFIALLIDLFIIGIYFFSLVALLNKVHISQDMRYLFIFLVILLPVLLYSFLWETFNQGQSIGKRLMNIRVVKADGSTPSISAYLLRWLLFVIDVPLTSGLGVLVILLTKNSQRLGDLAAGTMVIKDKNYRKIHVSLDEFNHLTQNYHPVYTQAADLSLEQVDVITRTLNSGQKDRSRRVEALGRKVKETLQVTVKEPSQEAFLQTILRDYQFYALEEF